MSKVIRKVRFWFDNKDWYKERQIIWKLGLLLYGKPGSGKTSLIRALGEDLDIPVHTFDLASMDNSDFISAWTSTRKDSPRIIVLEDFDTVFHGRENIIPDSTLEYGTILNAIDGLEREHGLLLFITTNHVGQIDEAMGIPNKGEESMSTRPGRIDIVMEMKDLDRAGRLKIALRILKGEDEIAEVMTDRYSSDTPAQFQYRCMQKALEIKWGIEDEV
jgi:SpoVK/Ycf46/Vps4 family AAA+-type ATPase